ncbi:hypothetical protein AK830_g5168 [Neonectria ditissima]|uniref:Uncharacterized protein n=1 Tax=Neonectria ditissima TaxID=78410 RepID=A0A0P7B4X3_9HYPO|nr:hypothetical protein AK830_g5168 [Neonectria ditissima]
MHFFTAAFFTALLGSVAAAPAELVARQALIDAVVVCVDGTFADPISTIPSAVCVSTYGCQSGSQPTKAGSSWTAACHECPSGQNVNKFGNCVFSPL